MVGLSRSAGGQSVLLRLSRPGNQARVEQKRLPMSSLATTTRAAVCRSLFLGALASCPRITAIRYRRRIGLKAAGLIQEATWICLPPLFIRSDMDSVTQIFDI